MVAGPRKGAAFVGIYLRGTMSYEVLLRKVLPAPGSWEAGGGPTPCLQGGGAQSGRVQSEESVRARALECSSGSLFVAQRSSSEAVEPQPLASLMS